MNITTKTRYSLRMLLMLADNYKKKPVFLKDIALQEGLSEKYLSLIVISLKKHGLIETARGVHTGYVLSRSPEKITLHDIMKIFESSPLVPCSTNKLKCKRNIICRARAAWEKLEATVSDTTRHISLSDILRGELTTDKIVPQAEHSPNEDTLSE